MGIIDVEKWKSLLWQFFFPSSFSVNRTLEEKVSQTDHSCFCQELSHDDDFLVPLNKVICDGLMCLRINRVQKCIKHLIKAHKSRSLFIVVAKQQSLFNWKFELQILLTTLVRNFHPKYFPINFSLNFAPELWKKEKNSKH